MVWGTTTVPCSFDAQNVAAAQAKMCVERVDLLSNLLEIVSGDSLFAVNMPPSVNCNDFFGPGCADAVEIEASDLDAVQKAIDDVENVLHSQRNIPWSLELWACRKMGAQPCTSAMKTVPEELQPLFEAARKK